MAKSTWTPAFVSFTHKVSFLLVAVFLGVDSCLLGATEATCFLVHDQREDRNSAWSESPTLSLQATLAQVQEQ